MRPPSLLGRRAVLRNSAAAAAAATAGCQVTAPTSRHEGLYHFTMPPERSIGQLTQALSKALGPTSVDEIIDVTGDGLGPGDVVTVKAPTRSVGTVAALERLVRADLRLPDFEADLEVVETAHWIGNCRRDRESLIAGGQTNCAPVPRTPTDLAWPLHSMNVPTAWQYSVQTGRPALGEGILIGHIDTGIAEHVDINENVLVNEGYNLIEREMKGGYDPLINNVQYFEQIGHGTATASVMVSRGNILQWIDRSTCGGTTSPGRITGTAPLAQLLPVRAFRLAATRNLARIAEAVNILRKRKVDVITMALGWAWPSSVLETALREAIAANILVLAAAGNFVGKVVYPANGGDVIAVGGTGPDDEAWCGSSHGPAVTISAPGDKVWRAYRNEKSRRIDLIGPRFGTSFAVSLTAGIGALWLAHHGRQSLISRLNNKKPTLQSAFQDALVRTARQPTGWELHGHGLGAGIVDAYALLRAKPIAHS